MFYIHLFTILKNRLSHDFLCSSDQPASLPCIQFRTTQNINNLTRPIYR